MIQPILTIIIPIYNVEDYIEQCLDSILNSSKTALSQIELLIVDDKSPDNSMEIVERKLQDHPVTAKIIRHQENLGLGGARNSGIAQANGKFTTFLDSDDWYALGGIQKIITSISTKKPADIYVFGFKAIKFNDVSWSYEPIQEVVTSEEGLLRLSLDKINPAVWNKVYKTEIVKKIQFPLHRYYEDLEYTPQAFQEARTIEIINHSLVFYRQDGVSITRQKTKRKHIEDISEVLLTLNSQLNNQEVISNFFINRWTYLINIWELNESLFHLALVKIDQFLDDNNTIDFSTSLASIFFEALKDSCIELNSFDKINTLLNRLHVVVSAEDNDVKPLISVVVPVFNAELFIDKFIAKYTAQKISHVQFIFVDDFSSDSSLDILLKYKEVLSHHVIIKTLNNFGAGTARNIGLNVAKGQYIVFQDIDDLPSEKLLEKVIKTIEESNNPDLIIHSFSVINADYSYSWTNNKILNLEKISYNGNQVFEFICGSIINPAPWNKIFKRSVWESNAIFFTPWIHHQDLSTIPFACYRSDHVVLLKESLYDYYTNEKGVTQTLTDKHVYSVFYSLTHLFDRFEMGSVGMMDHLNEFFLLLAFENVSYNYSLRGDFFTDIQFENFVKNYNDFVHYVNVEFTYLINSRVAKNLLVDLILESEKRGIPAIIDATLSPEVFKDFVTIQGQIDHQIELLMEERKVLDTKIVNNTSVTQKQLKTVLGNEEKLNNLITKFQIDSSFKNKQIAHKNDVIQKKEDQLFWYSDTYDHLPLWFLKIGAIFRRMNVRKGF
jgi:glycosyltransferase involved in cell wall biosynthesis